MWVRSTSRETSSAGRNDLFSEVKNDLTHADRLGLSSETFERQKWLHWLLYAFFPREDTARIIKNLVEIGDPKIPIINKSIKEIIGKGSFFNSL